MISSHTYRPRFYFVVTFFSTFVLWFAGAFVSWQEGLHGLYMVFMLPGLMAPFLVSLFMVCLSGNADLKRDFANRLTNLRLIEPKMLPAFFLMMPLIVVTSILLSIPLGESPEQLRLAEGFSFSTGFVPVFMILLLAAAFEELGWRGYAFDSLQSRFNYLTASVVFSILWSFWHFPLIFVKNSYQYEILHQNPWFAVNFFLSIIPMGIIISWVCTKNGKSVIAAIFFHLIINLCQEMFAITQVTKSIETVVLTLVAVVIIARDREFFCQSF